jgi:mycothiol synthase
VAGPSVVEVAPARFPEVRELVARIDADARAADGHPALGDAVWLDLEHPGADSAGYLVGESAYAHIGRGDNATPAHWTLGLALAPSARATSGVRHALVTAAAAHVAANGGGLMVLWVLGATTADDAELSAAALVPARDLYEMRVALPLEHEPKWPAGTRVRSFEPGQDETAWLTVNNEAFAGHAEQGGWTADTLVRRVAEPWFDPALFLLAFADADDTLLGFNWLKVHDADENNPRLGEIYVIGVARRAQGTGLGKALAIAGLAAVYERGIETGGLFCAADNEPALRLYRSLGFAVHRVDRAYEREVLPA